MPEDKDLRIKDVNSRDGISTMLYFGGADIELSLINPAHIIYATKNIRWVCRYVPSYGVPAELGKTEIKYGNSISLQTEKEFGGTIEITVTDIGGCPGNTGTYTVKVMASVVEINHTNPASGSVGINVVRRADMWQDMTEGTTAMSAPSAGETYKEPYDGAYRLELWHEVYGLVREMDVEEDNSSVTMNLHGLTPGMYYIRLITDGELSDVSKLVIQ